MMEWFKDLTPVLQGLLAGLFTWTITALGAATVFLAKKVGRKLLDSMLGFAGGVMLAASYWSLLAPSIEIAEESGGPAWLPATVGFLLGSGSLFLLDKVLPHLHPGLPMSRSEGPSTGLQRSTLLVLAITLHNIPEGLAVGVAFGGAVSGMASATVGSAIALAVGIGLQNFPEGIAVAMPLRADGMSRLKAFLAGQASGIVEPLAAVFGAFAVTFAKPVLPYGLAFAAGAMVYVVVEELVPEYQDNGNADLGTIFLTLGFAVMMVLDVALG